MRTSAAWELAAEVVQVSDLAFPPAEIIMRVADGQWGNEDFIGRAATASVETGMSSWPGDIRILSMRPSECRNIHEGQPQARPTAPAGLSGAKDEGAHRDGAEPAKARQAHLATATIDRQRARGVGVNCPSALVLTG